MKRWWARGILEVMVDGGDRCVVLSFGGMLLHGLMVRWRRRCYLEGGVEVLS